MNNVYLKGNGDFTPPTTNEPSDDQIIRATRENPKEVARNARQYFGMELESALFVLCIAKTKADELYAIDQVREVLNKSAVDLLECEAISND